MSTEAPAASAPTESNPQVQVQAPSFGGSGNPTVTFGGGMSDLLSRGNKKFQALPESKETPQPEKKETPEPAKVETQPEVKKEPDVPAKGSKEENLANMRKRIEALEKDLSEKTSAYETIQKEYETHKSKPFELPEEHKTRFETLEKERNQFQQELRAANLARDPEFVQRYEKSIQTHVGVMAQIAKEAGVPEDQIRAGMAAWNENTFGEWLIFPLLMSSENSLT